MAEHGNGEEGQRKGPGVIEGLGDLGGEAIVGFKKHQVVEPGVQQPEEQGAAVIRKGKGSKAAPAPRAGEAKKERQGSDAVGAAQKFNGA